MPLLENLFPQGTVERLGWMLVHFLWQATAVVLLLAVLLRLMRRVDASLRYAVACGALTLMVALPLITMQLVEVSGPAAEAGPPPAPPQATAVTPAPLALQVVDDLPPLSLAPPLEIVDVTTPIAGQERIVMILEPALPYAVLGWLVGVFGLSAWHLGGWAQLQRLKRRMTRRAGAAVQATLGELADRLGVHRAVTLLESAIVEVPTVVGWLRPVILLPASALTGLSPDQLRAILAHELAHIRRYDYLANMLQTVVEILGFYHPAVWWVAHRIRIERENCCDDLAVRICGNSLQYARALTSMEEMRHSRSDLAMAASGGSLMARVARLLGRPTADDRRFAWLPGLITLLLIAGILMPITLTLGAAGLSQGQSTTTDPDDMPDWAKASLAALPGWEMEHLDAAPSVVVGHRKGLRLTIRKGRREYLDLEPRQRGEYSQEELRKARYVMRYQHVEIVVFPGGELPADAQAKIGWTQWKGELPHFKKAVHMGQGMGMDWYARATIYDQERLRQSLKLDGGADQLALLTEGMQVQDEGGMTRNSCVHLLAAAGDMAIPYIQSAVEGHEHGVQTIYALAFIQTDAATEYLKRLYQAKPTRAFAEYALIHEPFRQHAKEQYLDMLRRRRYVVETANASVQFGWKEAIPLLNTVYEQTHALGEFGVAFHAARTLEGRPVPPEIDQAQKRLQQWVYSEQPPTEEELAGAKAMLLSSRDTEGAIVAAIQVAMLGYKASHERLNPIREVGREIVRELPREETARIINRLAASMMQASDEWSARRLLDVLSPERSKPSRLGETAPPVPPDPMLPVPPLPISPTTMQQGRAGKTADGSAVQVMEETRAGDDVERRDPVPILIKFSLFPKVSANKVVDHETRLLLGGVLTAENPYTLHEIIHADPKEKVTLGEVLRTSVAGRPMAPQTMELLIDVLQSRGYLQGEATPEILVNNSQQAAMHIGTEELILPPADPASSPDTVKLGTFVQVTPHFPSLGSDRITLEIAAQWKERAKPDDPTSAPAVRTTELASTVTVPRDRCFMLLAEPYRTASAETTDSELLLVMFRADLFETTANQQDVSVPHVPSGQDVPRQVLLDARVVMMERGDLRNLGVEWGFPTWRAGQALDDSSWLRGIQIGYSADQTSTNSLVATLDQLQAANRADVVAHPQLMAQDGQPAQLRSVEEEWFLISDPERAGPALRKIGSGTVLTMTPRVGDHNEITVEMMVEINDSFPRGTGSDLPIVTRRVAKNLVTIRDGGTVAVAGLRGSLAGQDERSKEIAILVTARLVPETLRPQQGRTGPSAPPISRPEPAVPPSGATTRQAGITASFTDMDLFKALAQISTLSGAKIAVDLTVKPQPITVELLNTSVPAAIQQVLQGTPYTFQPVNEGNALTYLIYRPLSGKFEGVDLVQALGDLAADTGVPIIPDPNVHGQVWTRFENVPLEKALQMVLAGRPYFFKKTPHYYLVGSRPPFTGRASESGISTQQTADARRAYTNADPMVRELLKSIVQIERDLIALQQTRLGTHPDVAQKQALLKAFKDRLQQQRSELEHEFDKAHSGRLKDRETEQVARGDQRHILLRATLAWVLANRRLDRNTATEVFDMIAPGDTALPPKTRETLRTSTVGEILESLAGQVPAETFRAVVRFLESKGLVDSLAEPQLVMLAGRPAEISGGNLTLRVLPDVLKAGQTIRLDVEVSMELEKPIPSTPGGTHDPSPPITSTQTIRTAAVLEIPNGRHGVSVLGGVMPGTKQADAMTYCLLFQPTLVTPDVRREAPSADENTDDSQAAADANQPPRAWTIMRQYNSPPLLQGLGPQLARLLEPEHQNDPAWQPSTDDGQLMVNLDMDEPTHVEVTIGLFEDAEWSKDPVAVRRVAGKGMHLLTELPVGWFQIGAIAGTYAHALGVQRQWPQPVEIRRGQVTSIRLLVSKASTATTGLQQQGTIWDYLGH